MTKSFNILSAGTAIGAALMLAACHPSADGGANGNVLAMPALPATLPLAAGAASSPTYAPPADALPAAPRLRTVRVADPRDAYAYADDAWDFGDAIYDAPPDYGFDYAGVEPWAWEGYDQSLVFVEPIDDGYRYYYYQPGADEPYFVRDPDYGYGYDDGQLAVIYGPDGAILPYDGYGPHIDYAARYLTRGRALYAASRERDRRSVNAANWAARAAAISAAQSRWAAERAQQGAWRDYHQRVAAEATRHWQPERTRREADAQRFANWQRSDYRAAPPPRVIPATWQQAHWARDDRRYVALPAAPDQAARQQAEQQRGFGRPQQAAAAAAAAATAAAAIQAHNIQRQQQQAAAQQQARAHQDQQHAADIERAQAERAMRQANAGQKRAALQPQLNPQRQQAQAQAQAREAQRAQMQARQAQAGVLRAQAQARAGEQARAAQAAREHAAGQAQREQQAAGMARARAQQQQQAAGMARARAEQQAAGMARARAEQQAHAQAARGQAEAMGRARAQAAQAQAHAQMQAARAQAARPAPQAPRPQAQALHAPARPPAAPTQHGGAPGHEHHPG